MKKRLLVFVTLVSLFGVVSCAQSSGDYYDNIKEADVSSLVTSSGETKSSEQKIYYTVDIDATVPDIKEALNYTDTLVSKYNGYVFDIRTSLDDEGNYDYANYCYKIPSSSYMEFIDDLENKFTLTSKNIEGTNITDSYNNNVARKEVLDASRAAYLKMLDKDDLTVSDVIAINNKIEDIDTELLKINSTLESYDKLIAYTSVYVSYSLKDQSKFLDGYWEYVANVFVGIFKFLLYVLPFAFVGFGIFSAIFFPIKAHNKKVKKEVNKKKK